MHIENVIDRYRPGLHLDGGFVFDEVYSSGLDCRPIIVLTNDGGNERLRTTLWTSHSQYPETAVSAYDTHIVQRKTLAAVGAILDYRQHDPSHFRGMILIHYSTRD